MMSMSYWDQQISINGLLKVLETLKLQWVHISLVIHGRENARARAVRYVLLENASAILESVLLEKIQGNRNF